MPTSLLRHAAALLLGAALAPGANALDNGDEAPAGLMRPRAAPAARTVGAPPPASLHFASPEHEFLGRQVLLTLPDGRRVPGDQAALLSVPTSGPAGDSVELSYAELLYLSGDYYGVPYASIVGDTPFDVFDATPTPAEIAARMKLVRNLLAFQYLGYADYLPRIRELESELMRRFDDARRQDRALPYGTDDDCASMLATGADGCLRDASELLNLRKYLGLYTELASRSTDHFHADAQSAFLLGVKMALELALGAAGPDDLRFAYVLTAYASHFGSDAFAAGHVRTDKRTINAYCAPQLARFGFDGWNGLLLSGVLVKRMHDDDNARGIVVTGGDGRQWKAYGDLSMSRRDNDANTARAVDTLQRAVDRVHEAYERRGQVDPGAFIEATLRELRQRLPDIAATSADSEHNPAALFETRGAQVWWNDPEQGSRELDCREAVLRYIQELGAGSETVERRLREAEPTARSTGGHAARAARSIDVGIELVEAQAEPARSLVCEWGKRQHGDFPDTQGAFSMRVGAHLESNGGATGAEGDLYCLVLEPQLRQSPCQFTVHFDNPFVGDDAYQLTRLEGACKVDVDDNGRGEHWAPRIVVRQDAQS